MRFSAMKTAWFAFRSKALETLVNKCLNQHAELKVVTSSLYSDEESIRVDVHISLQSDISMPLAISALQKADQEVFGSLLRRDGAGGARLCGQHHSGG